MDQILFANTSNVIRFKLTQSSSGANPGEGLTGLTSASSGLIIGTICDNEATTTRYRASSSEIEDVTSLGTFSAPNSGKVRFKEVDATNHKGLYEIQLANARFAVASSRKLVVTVSGATNLQQADYEIQLTRNDPYLDKLGAWTGTGANNVLGGIRAICRDDATLPTDIAGTYDNASMSLEAFDSTALSPTDIADAVTVQVNLSKNVAFPNFPFEMRNADGTLADTLLAASVTCIIQKDGGNFAAVTATPVAKTNGGVKTGAFRVDLSATEMNANAITFIASATGVRTTLINIITQD